MQETRYGLRVSMSVPYEEAVRRATDAVKSQGFGVLTTIDVQQTLKTKEVGLLLPCNVIVYETAPSSSVVAAMAPLAALGIVGDKPGLAEVAREADERLRTALSQLEPR
jgi:uncharacterized protein (DUF302 family)